MEGGFPIAFPSIMASPDQDLLALETDDNLSSSDEDSPTPCHCGHRRISLIQTRRISELESAFQETVQDNGRLHARKEVYKGRWNWLEEEIAQMLDERMEYQNTFHSSLTRVQLQLERMNDILNPSPDTQHATPCCAVHSTSLSWSIARAYQIIDEWIQKEERACDFWLQKGRLRAAKTSAPVVHNPAEPGELSIDRE